jgi:aspartate kinase
MRVLKFGGTSVEDEAAIERLAAIVARERAADALRSREHATRAGIVVVVSALGGATDCLLATADRARAGDEAGARELLESLRARHLAVAAVADGAAARTELRALVDAQFDDLAAVVRSLAVLREVPPRSLDAVAAVAAALASRALPATWADPRTFIVTDDQFTAAAPMMPETWARVAAALGPLLDEGRVAVTGGFVGATAAGVTATLGRGGSDYSASIIGSGLAADEIQIWTDVDGMLTADPRVFPHPQLVPQLSFAEAAELAYFGAKVLHPKTIQPALAREIPVRILNSRASDQPGTRITAAPNRSGGPVTAFASKRHITVIHVTSTRMLAAHGFLRRLFEVFERHRTSVDVVTTSEVSVSVTIDDNRRLGAIVADLEQFADVVVDEGLALIGIVGDNLQADSGTFGRLVAALGPIPLELVSQSASRRNVTVVLAETELAGALARLHESFFGAETVGVAPAAGRAHAGA